MCPTLSIFTPNLVLSMIWSEFIEWEMNSGLRKESNEVISDSPDLSIDEKTGLLSEKSLRGLGWEEGLGAGYSV